jgi:hypothetical protein
MWPVIYLIAHSLLHHFLLEAESEKKSFPSRKCCFSWQAFDTHFSDALTSRYLTASRERNGSYKTKWNHKITFESTLNRIQQIFFRQLWNSVTRIVFTPGDFTAKMFQCCDSQGGVQLAPTWRNNRCLAARGAVSSQPPAAVSSGSPSAFLERPSFSKQPPISDWVW